MKLIMAVVDKKDAKGAVADLMKGGFSVTKVSSVGGFLQDGKTTLMIGTHAERVKQAVDILRSTCKVRKYELSKVPKDMRPLIADTISETNELTVGGAMVFVLNIEENYKL